jgi:hypothetical protein
MGVPLYVPDSGRSMDMDGHIFTIFFQFKVLEKTCAKHESSA